jgi:hypothetical protein
MPTIAINVNGKPVFSWECDADLIRDVLADFPRAARHVNKTPTSLAHGCLANLIRDGSLLANDGQEVQKMAAVWCVLKSDTRNAEHPGKIADYAAAIDFDVNFTFDGSGHVLVEAMARLPKLHS